ncbi:hypothetical protein BU23DRAFT_550460 [Bimuria novae-zelandiae CBS 107.79]|uniref:Uncharacterized protein n=1 Tax=Bimuria novae-zelandiae CBS 107.79 TaxID=1447943 RepID=A0A6A5VSC9_9PLEO|nr:hypothetical protein BU23DRAFT_550460 [Bimuria novae-zelandiae CBS 107.79]
MRFTAALSTLLLGASLTTSVLAAPRPIETQLERRFQNLDDDVQADYATWEYFAGNCGGGSSKRSLHKRAIDVPMSDSMEMDVPLGLKTSQLRSCIGVVITGKKKDGGLFRVLGHFAAAHFMLQSEWDKFTSEYNKAGDIDKGTTQGYMSVPDYKKKYENGATGFYADENGEKKDATKLSEEFEDELKKRVDDLVDGNPQMFPRDVDIAEGSTMEVNEKNEVFINGKRV